MIAECSGYCRKGAIDPECARHGWDPNAPRLERIRPSGILFLIGVCLFVSASWAVLIFLMYVICRAAF